ncbi:hypothetical protein [Paraliobacillus sp. X-1268]|uniref:hypothetical protein n=1 Tax=Paraliobacillus sp. X-1268 TaxID=2213193 RepID=UPI000E3C358E|nr:hypothetical protein [Paraliobacillus sp. X-1268]
MYKDLMDRLDGYTIGTTIVDDGDAYLIKQDGSRFDLDTDCQIELLTNTVIGGEYVEITFEELRDVVASDGGIPLYAGFYARVKRS